MRSPGASGRHVAGLRRVRTPEPHVLASSLLRHEFSPRGVGGDRPSLPLLASPPLPAPSRQCAALCKSPHMLPRVPVSQRHSRALFRTSVTRHESPGGQEGAIKRSFSLYLTRTAYTEGERHPRNYGHCAYRYREREAGVCALCACVCTLRVRVRARRVPFSVPRAEPPRPRRRIATFAEGRGAVNRVE